MNTDRRVTAVLCALVVASFPARASATRGPDDHGMWYGIAAFLLPVTLVLAAVVYFALRWWARRTGRREGRFLTTWLGGVAGAATMPLVRELSIAKLPDSVQWTVLVLVLVAPMVLGTFLGFFVWRGVRTRR